MVYISANSRNVHKTFVQRNASTTLRESNYDAPNDPVSVHAHMEKTVMHYTYFENVNRIPEAQSLAKMSMVYL